ncbi:MAG: HNH endonuclease [Arthrobacter sp.]|nr:HNH endonuclease [Arthrobacter sp.]
MSAVLDVEAIRNATTLLRFVSEAGQEAWDGAPEEDVVLALQAVAAASRTLDALKVGAAGAVERRSEPLTRAESLSSRLGFNGSRALIAEVFGTGFYQARSWTELASDTHTPIGAAGPRRPALAEALRRGELGIEAAKVIRDALAEVTQESIAGGTLAAEATLVANATAGRVNLVARPVEVEAGAAAGEGPGAEPGGGLGVEYWPVVPPRSAGDLAGERAGATAGEAGDGWAGPGVAGGGDGSTLFGGDAGGSNPGGGAALSPNDPDGTVGAGAGAGAGADGWPGGAAGDRADGWPAGVAGDRTDAGRGVPVGWFASRRGAPTRGGVFQGAGAPAAGGRPSLKNVKQQAKGWGMILEPRKAELSHEAQYRARSFELTPVAGGGYKLAGYAPEVEGQVMLTLLDAYLAPRTADPQEAGAGGGLGGESAGGVSRDGSGGPSAEASALAGASHGTEGASAGAGTSRGAGAAPSRAQKSFDALAQIFRSHAASGDAPQSASAAPTVLITTTMQALDAHLERCSEHEGEATPESGHRGCGGGGGGGGGGAGGGDDGAGGGGGGWWPMSVAELPVDANGVPDAEALIDLRFARIGQEGEPVPLSAVLHLMCDAAVQLLLQDPQGIPLKLGRAKRVFSKDQRRVLAQRDHHCRAPGCDIPARWCEVHHVEDWRSGGKTDVENGILLCSFHHHEIDRGRLRVAEHPDPGTPFKYRHQVRMPRPTGRRARQEDPLFG